MTLEKSLDKTSCVFWTDWVGYNFSAWFPTKILKPEKHYLQHESYQYQQQRVVEINKLRLKLRNVIRWTALYLLLKSQVDLVC